jgi:hypothetical protein
MGLFSENGFGKMVFRKCFRGSLAIEDTCSMLKKTLTLAQWLFLNNGMVFFYLKKKLWLFLS